MKECKVVQDNSYVNCKPLANQEAKVSSELLEFLNSLNSL